MRKMRKHMRGVNLMELMIVITIIRILISIIISRLISTIISISFIHS